MVSRREWLQRTASGFGWLALAALAQESSGRAREPAGGTALHHPPRARRVVFLCMDGAPSHVDTFDHKPRLTADSGRPAPRAWRTHAGGTLLGSPFPFARHGESGLWISSLFPEVARHADKLCVLNGMHTDLPNHAQAFLQMHCGISQFPRPSLGAWVLYGLGSLNDNLPGFVTIAPPRTNGGAANYGASFLPVAHQGTRIDGRRLGTGQPVESLANPRRDLAAQRLQLDYIQQLNRATAATLGGSPEIDGLIESYEMAFRMQGELPGVLDLEAEPKATLERYRIGAERSRGGPAAPAGDDFAKQCLLARRLLEAGVRFVEVTAGGWDHHRQLKESLTASCAAVDGPIAALLTDLEQRGLLADTLVLWGGEFGRTPWAQGDGRDHNHKAYSMWMAGGGVRGGLAFGKTDDHGAEVVEDAVHVHDWHATILHLLGLDHERLTFRHGGREMRLTDVKGSVVRGILA